MGKDSSKSLKVNMILNAIKGLMSVIFPLISFPYVSKILGVENIGKYNFANSFIVYFILIAGLGISTYSIREGARIRECKEELEKFVAQMVTVNFIAMIISYGLLFMCLTFVHELQEYRELIIILSTQILFTTLGVEWIFSIFEDYLFITIRSIFAQLISLLLLFVFVKTKEDVNVYAIITALASAGSGIFNYFRAKKYVKIRLTNKLNLAKHFKSIMVMFAMAVSVKIYVSSDVVILGLMSGDYAVGIYSVSSKVYTIVKSLLSSILIVSIPRLSMLLGQNKVQQFKAVANDVYNTLMSILLPAMIGIVLLRKQIIILISDETFVSANVSLAILTIALLFCFGAWFWAQCVLIPYKRETFVFKATFISAIINIVLNIILIPHGQENAAAFTTLISEGVSFILCAHEGARYLKIKGCMKTIFKILLGCVVMVTYIILINMLDLKLIESLVVTIGGAVVIYIVVEIMVKNESVISFLEQIQKRIKR